MSKTDSSQPQKEAATDAARKRVDDHVDRIEAAQKDYTRLESQAFAQVNKNIDEAARLFKETVAYNSQLSAEWRRLSLDAMRRSAAMFSGGWAA